MQANGDPYATYTSTDTRRVRQLYRVTVAQAAERLGITQDAVRQRIRRNTIQHDKDENGRVYVYLDTTHTEHNNVHDTVHDSVRDELVEELRDRVRYLEEESRRKDSIILTMAQRIPELEAAPEPREATTSDSEGASASAPSESDKQRSWWRRVFG